MSPVVKNPSCNARDTDSISSCEDPTQGTSNPCATHYWACTLEPTSRKCRSPHTPGPSSAGKATAKSSTGNRAAPTLYTELERAHRQQWRPTAARNKKNTGKIFFQFPAHLSKSWRKRKRNRDIKSWKTYMYTHTHTQSMITKIGPIFLYSQWTNTKL